MKNIASESVKVSLFFKKEDIRERVEDKDVRIRMPKLCSERQYYIKK